MEPKVSILKTDNFTYDIDRLRDSLTEGLDLVLGKDYFQNKSKVLIKPNLLMNAAPQDAVTTHPNFIIALARALKEKGLHISVVDNPGGFGSNPSIREIYQGLGLDRHSELFDLLYNDRPPSIQDDMPFSWWTRGFDEIINAPKFKTHDLMGLTLAMKNTYGFIQGIRKSSLHKEFPKPTDFARVIVKIHTLIAPGVNVLDGIVTLEGEGPAKKGIPTRRGLILFSNAAWALDWVAAKLIRIDPQKISYLRVALQEKLIEPSKIKVYPQDWQKYKIDDFNFPAPTIIESFPPSLLKTLGSLLAFKPVINNRRCQVCEKCIETCPVSAIRLLQGERVVIDYKECIMCMCCQEVCPYGAVEIQYSLFYRLLKALSKMGS